MRKAKSGGGTIGIARGRSSTRNPATWLWMWLWWWVWPWSLALGVLDSLSWFGAGGSINPRVSPYMIRFPFSGSFLCHHPPTTTTSVSPLPPLRLSRYRSYIYLLSLTDPFYPEYLLPLWIWQAFSTAPPRPPSCIPRHTASALYRRLFRPQWRINPNVHCLRSPRCSRAQMELSTQLVSSPWILGNTSILDHSAMR
jgi:hypothetical protein